MLLFFTDWQAERPKYIRVSGSYVHYGMLMLNLFCKFPKIWPLFVKKFLFSYYRLFKLMLIC